MRSSACCTSRWTPRRTYFRSRRETPVRGAGSAFRCRPHLTPRPHVGPTRRLLGGGCAGGLSPTLRASATAGGRIGPRRGASPGESPRSRTPMRPDIEPMTRNRVHATRATPTRREHAEPGDLIHVDVMRALDTHRPCEQRRPIPADRHPLAQVISVENAAAPHRPRLAHIPLQHSIRLSSPGRIPIYERAADA